MGSRPLGLPHSEQGRAQLKRTLGGTGVSEADEAGPSTGNPGLPAPTFFCLMTPHQRHHTESYALLSETWVDPGPQCSNAEMASAGLSPYITGTQSSLLPCLV